MHWMQRVTPYATGFRHTRNEKVIGSIPISGSMPKVI